MKKSSFSPYFFIAIRWKKASKEPRKICPANKTRKKKGARRKSFLGQEFCALVLVLCLFDLFAKLLSLLYFIWIFCVLVCLSVGNPVWVSTLQLSRLLLFFFWVGWNTTSVILVLWQSVWLSLMWCSTRLTSLKQNYLYLNTFCIVFSPFVSISLCGCAERVAVCVFKYLLPFLGVHRAHCAKVNVGYEFLNIIIQHFLFSKSTMEGGSSGVLCILRFFRIPLSLHNVLARRCLFSSLMCMC